MLSCRYRFKRATEQKGAGPFVSYETKDQDTLLMETRGLYRAFLVKVPNLFDRLTMAMSGTIGKMWVPYSLFFVSNTSTPVNKVCE